MRISKRASVDLRRAAEAAVCSWERSAPLRTAHDARDVTEFRSYRIEIYIAHKAGPIPSIHLDSHRENNSSNSRQTTILETTLQSWFSARKQARGLVAGSTHLDWVILLLSCSVRRCEDSFTIDGDVSTVRSSERANNLKECHCSTQDWGSSDFLPPKEGQVSQSTDTHVDKRFPLSPVRNGVYWWII